jgi:hypothetical protein
MFNHETEPSPCPECGGTRLLIPRAVELMIPGGHVNEGDPFGLICTQCGYISFYATPMTLAAIAEIQEKVRLYRAKEQDQAAQVQQEQNAHPIKKK